MATTRNNSVGWINFVAAADATADRTQISVEYIWLQNGATAGTVVLTDFDGNPIFAVAMPILANELKQIPFINGRRFNGAKLGAVPAGFVSCQLWLAKKAR